MENLPIFVQFLICFIIAAGTFYSFVIFVYWITPEDEKRENEKAIENYHKFYNRKKDKK